MVHGPKLQRTLLVFYHTPQIQSNVLSRTILSMRFMFYSQNLCCSKNKVGFLNMNNLTTVH